MQGKETCPKNQNTIWQFNVVLVRPEKYPGLSPSAIKVDGQARCWQKLPTYDQRQGPEPFLYGPFVTEDHKTIKLIPNVHFD